VIHGRSTPRTAFLAGLGTLLASLVAGCSSFNSLESVRYPEHLRYPPRQDVLVEKAPTKEERKLPPPGELEQHIVHALEADKEKAKWFNPKDLSAEDGRQLRAALRAVFGTPRDPRIRPSEDSDNRGEYNAWLGKWMGTLAFRKADELSTVIAPGGEDEEQILRRGSVLYRRHCLHCHGLSGDGRGPTGPWVHPHPRDYRRGQFKFISTGGVRDRKPRRADLVRILTRGIDGTSMPAFGLLPEHELEYLASYVIHLSLRGQVEFETMKTLLSEGGKDNLDRLKTGDEPDVVQHVYSQAARILISWADSNSAKPYEPGPYTEPKDDTQRYEAIRRGHQIFIGSTGCVACHNDYGRQVPYKYDEWGTLVRPANLTVGLYRGGRRPIDLFWRIKGGIPPAGMPAATLSDPDYWNLVEFVRALPYPAMLPDDVRKAVYGSPSTEGAHARLMK
jgi:mono/diheme cytochrome c family protein